MKFDLYLYVPAGALRGTISYQYRPDEGVPFSVVAYGMGRARHNDYKISSVGTSVLKAVSVRTSVVLAMHAMHTAASITLFSANEGPLTCQYPSIC